MSESMGIEKVVVELNGFRQRTSMLKEEIGRVSRALAERAGQLNDIVGKSLRDLRNNSVELPFQDSCLCKESTCRAK